MLSAKTSVPGGTRVRRRRSASRARAAAADEYSNEVKMRSEAQAPFRVLRQFVIGGLGASATIGTGIATIQLVTGALGAPAAPPVIDSAKNLAIDIAGLAGCYTLYQGDAKARDRQLKRLSREENLWALKMELMNGNVVSVAEMRGFARVVVVAGSTEEVRAAMASAEPHKPELLRRGVTIVPLVTTPGQPQLELVEGAGGEEGGAGDAADAKEAQKYRATPVGVEAWREYFADQLADAKLARDATVYICLRLDGRVRGSGKGAPPFARLASELPPMEGMWATLGAGMDGSVGVDS
mmetsp:Transcript_29085/g.94965  ORF Transcript_29085/g.94965 Transcript_29085/m.94965 type:complete len:296 (-) Transcript_29085:1551-2438(-)